MQAKIYGVKISLMSNSIIRTFNTEEERDNFFKKVENTLIENETEKRTFVRIDEHAVFNYNQFSTMFKFEKDINDVK